MAIERADRVLVEDALKQQAAVAIIGPRQVGKTTLARDGALKMPEEEMDWNQFFLIPAGDVSRGFAVEAAINSRGNR